MRPWGMGVFAGNSPFSPGQCQTCFGTNQTVSCAAPASWYHNLPVKCLWAWLGPVQSVLKRCPVEVSMRALRQWSDGF